MNIFHVVDIFGDEIHLTQERWQHILEHHPVMKEYLDHVRQTLAEPNVVQRSPTNPNEYRYYRFFEEVYGGKYVFVAVVKEADNFVVTPFITRTIRRGGEFIWMSK